MLNPFPSCVQVIGYIASHFRKDKIWMRRTRPDKRRYQVVVAIDDSRSMAETGCGPFALEALTLICKSMSRLEVGELGVVSFGGSGGAVPLHSLDRPFTDADGVRIMSHMRFDQDNTITDRPVVDVVASLSHILDEAAGRMPAYGSSLHQLVLIIADGRFHEKESLRRMVRDAACKPGVLYAFIVLDNPENSILDMQTVNFIDGKPVFAKYMDSFPFPFYIVVQNIAALPRTLSDLLQQWFQLNV
jgi:midasin